MVMSDASNPVYELEVTRRFGRHLGVVLPAAVLVLGTGAAGMASYRADAALVVVLIAGPALLAAVLPIMVGGRVAYRVADEWRRGMVADLSLTELTPQEILRGKFHAAALPAVWSILALAGVNTLAVLVSAVTGGEVTAGPGLLIVLGFALLGLAACYSAGWMGALVATLWRFLPGATGVSMFLGLLHVALWAWLLPLLDAWQSARFVPALAICLTLPTMAVCYVLASRQLRRALLPA
jgi:hypothetical protein